MRNPFLVSITHLTFMFNSITHPWPWYIAGPIIGLMVPALLILGNRSFGMSATLRHICAACFPSNIPFFKYNWKKESWNLFLALGIIAGGWIASTFMTDGTSVQVSSRLSSELSQYGISNYKALIPVEIMNWNAVLSWKGFILLCGGGFLVGFGTRYAGGCTSGHSIMGLALLQWPSLVATCCFMLGGFIMANLILPLILSL